MEFTLYCSLIWNNSYFKDHKLVKDLSLWKTRKGQ